LITKFYDSFKYKTFHGYRLLAIDGSVFTSHRNKETIAEFGENALSETRTWIKTQVSFATDVLNNICVEGIIAPYRADERKLALEHIKNIEGHNLYLFDRGYVSKEVLVELLSRKIAFCMRVPKSTLKEITNFINSKETDVVTGFKGYKIRLTKVELKSGETEYLLSSLTDMNRIGKTQLKALYHKRWGIEEQFKDFKHALAIENFVGKKVNSIKQEFHANIMSYNLTMMALTSCVDEVKTNKGKKKHSYKANKRASLAIIKTQWVNIFFSKENIEELLDKLIVALAQETVPIRNGRSYPRGLTKKTKKKHYINYVSVV